ncbi:MAG: hypothetical protein ACKOB4_08955 [Acidobacteriota bacterium]
MKNRLIIELYDATRTLVAEDFESQVTLLRGDYRQIHRGRHRGAQLPFEVELTNGPLDNYIVHVAASHHHDAWFHPVNPRRLAGRPLSLMLLPRRSRYRFEPWTRLSVDIRKFLAAGQSFHDELLDGTDERQDILAAFHNFTTALKSIELEGRSAFSYFRQLIAAGERSPERDRFYALAHKDLEPALERARQQKLWAKGSTAFHPGSTSSYKEKMYGEGNVQLSIYGNEKVGLSDCLMVEVDIDYYKDTLSHGLLELVPNKLLEKTTDPKMAYRLRWMAMRNIGDLRFDPPYVLERLDG